MDPPKNEGLFIDPIRPLYPEPNDDTASAPVPAFNLTNLDNMEILLHNKITKEVVSISLHDLFSVAYIFMRQQG
jgi:hypothetical protein